MAELKSNKPVLLGSLLFSLIFFGVVSNKLINKNIEQGHLKEYVVKHFYSDFNYKLSPKDKQRAEKIIINLSNDSIVFKRLSEFYSLDSLYYSKLREYRFSKNPESITSEIKELLKKRDLLLSNISIDINKNKNIHNQFKELFSIYSTNFNFRNNYTTHLAFKKFKKNPFAFFYSNKLEQKIKPYTHEFLNSGEKLKGFKTRYEKNRATGNKTFSEKVLRQKKPGKR